MNILAVDDEMLMLEALVECIEEAAPKASIVSFRKPTEALAYAKEHIPDVTFLDIRMRGMDGLALGAALLEINPKINLIYCTSYDEYISDAFRKLRCSGYITKPVDTAQVAAELRNLRNPVAEEHPRIEFRCLGRFEAFYEGKPIEFGNIKTKEMLAYLVHACGGVCSNQEICAILWDDDARHDSYYKKIRKELAVALTGIGCDEILIRHRGGLAIDTGLVDCDYYEWRKAHAGEKPEEYMTQYQWAYIPYYEW